MKNLYSFLSSFCLVGLLVARGAADNRKGKNKQRFLSAKTKLHPILKFREASELILKLNSDQNQQTLPRATDAEASFSTSSRITPESLFIIA